MEENNTDLKPCPFCGGPADYYESLVCGGWNENYTTGFVKCTRCGAQIKAQLREEYYGLPSKTKGEICAIWNRRADHGTE